MRPTCYLFHLYPTAKVLTLSNSEYSSDCWNLRIDGEKVGPDYNDPDQAALDASRADFEDQGLTDLFKKIRVPSNLSMWQPCHTNRKINGI